VKNMKKDVSKEHFVLGGGKSHFGTTNKELMKVASMPDLDTNKVRVIG